MIEFDAEALDWKAQYRLMHGAITPRPIALVTTLGSKGPNAAPFSFFNAVGCDPAMLMFSCGGREGGADKDTVVNLRQIPEFVVHIVADAIKEGMNVCGADYPLGINEIEKAGFTAAPSRKVRPPRILEAPVAMECRVMEMLKLGQRPYHLVVGEVLYFHFHDDLVDKRLRVDFGKINPVARLGGRESYARITDRFEMPRATADGKVEDDWRSN